MPRSRKPPRLYLDPQRRTWTVLGIGGKPIRTGFSHEQVHEAEAYLAQCIAANHKPKAKGDPMIADVLIVYHDEHLVYTASKESNLKVCEDAGKWWGEKRVSEVTPDNCRAYVTHKGESIQMARRGLETLRAAMNYWHKSEYGPLDRIPPVLLPPKGKRRSRWLTEEEFGRMLAAARLEHLRRLLIVGWLTGTRPGAVLRMEWDWIDFDARIMHRRAPGTPEQKRKRTPPVRIGQELLTHLRAWHEADGQSRKYVVHWNGKPVKDIKDSWRTAVRKAGLDEKVVRHTLRHSRATRLMRMGKDPWEVAQHLGMSLQMLEQVYGHHHPDFQKDVADA